MFLGIHFKKSTHPLLVYGCSSWSTLSVQGPKGLNIFIFQKGDHGNANMKKHHLNMGQLRDVNIP